MPGLRVWRDLCDSETLRLRPKRPCVSMTNPYDPPKAKVCDPESRASRGTELASHTLFARVSDGRIIFRPGGKRGRCYLLDERQRLVRARAQRVFWGLGLVANVIANQIFTVGMSLGVLLPVALGLQYLLFWSFTLGLPLTEPPPEIEGSKAQRREVARQRMRERARLMGKGRLWALLLGSLLFVAGGLLIAVSGGSIAAALGGFLFFGACAALFAWQLRQL